MYPQVFGKYVLERELARGGMARVVLATLRGAGGFEKRLVVKQIRDELACDDEFVRRFVEEAKTTVNLAHPNIVPVYELGVEMGTYFLAMELVEGASLAELLRAPSTGHDGQRGAPPRRLTPEEGAYVGVEVCRALDYAHRRMNVVHRDVTPRNVMVDEEGQIKVIDFGIAAPAASTSSGHGVFGSPGHMPPEQMAGRELTAAADVFAVAALLLELWSGEAPFRRRANSEIEAAMRGPHPKPSGADIRLLPLDEIIASALSLDASGRPQQADDLSRVLRRFLAGVDLGDVARHLGERVRAARAAAPPARDSTVPALQRPPSRPTATAIGTKTFAARAEVQALAARVTEPEPSTRRLVSAPPARREDRDVAAMPPIETRPGARPRQRPSRAAGWGLAAAACLAVTAFFVGKGTAPGPSSTPSAAAPLALEPPPVSPAPSFPASPEASAARATEAASSSAPTPAPARAFLTLLGDGVLVRVDGEARGACPARVAVPPGSHAILFAYPPTGESKVERLTLRSGEHATLRADFTTATPRVRIER